jgi:hypothetical protein
MHGPSREKLLVNPVYRDILSVFAEKGVKYLLVGGYALGPYTLMPAVRYQDR